MAVFDRAIEKLETISVDPLMEHADLLEALEDYEITFLSALPKSVRATGLMIRFQIMMDHHAAAWKSPC